MYRDNRPGCLMGLLQLFLLDKVFGWLQRSIGFSSGSVLGCGCGPILLVIFVLMACGIFCNTNWLKLFMP